MLERVSVVIVTYNKYPYVKALLDSLNNLNYPRDLLDVIVVDNNSVDDTEVKLRADFSDSITIIQTGKNLGGAGGFNTGMKYAVENLTNDYIWLLDNDVTVTPDALNELLKTLKAHGDVAAVGSMILQLDNPEFVSEIGAMMDWNKGKIIMLDAGKRFSEIIDKAEKVVDYCAAASLLKTRKSILQVGYWDDLFIHYDDVDWCLRAKSKGLKIYCNPLSIVFHESLNKKQATWIRYYNIRNLLYLYKNHASFLLFLPLVKFLFWSFYFYIHGYKKDARLVFKAIADFFQNKKAQQEFLMENYQSLKLSFLDHPVVLIFYSQDNLDSFLQATGFVISDKTKIIIYQNAKNIISLFLLVLKQLMLIAFRRDKVIIFDGDFQRFFMLPAFRKAIYVYPKFKTMVDLKADLAKNCSEQGLREPRHRNYSINEDGEGRA